MRPGPLVGIGEAFVHAVLDARGLSASNGLLLAFAGAHLAACVGLVGRHGALGLVAADGINMVLRIAYSAWWVRCVQAPAEMHVLLRYGSLWQSGTFWQRLHETVPWLARRQLARR